jgi:hypothetical protein
MIRTKLHQLFYGGISTDRKVGLEYSHAYSRALDFRKRPGRMSVLPGGREVGDSNITDLIQRIIQVDDGDRYALGNTGWIYSINSSNAVTPIAKLSSSGAGMLYRRDTDEFYATSSRTVSRYGKLSNSPVINMDKYGPSRSENEDALREGGANTITLSSTIDEGKKIDFTPDIEPLYSVKVKLVTKGTGDWTVTLHDDANNVLGTVTISNSSLPSSAELVEFVFSSQVRMLVSPNARTYHLHVTSSNATGTIQVGTVDDMTTADFEIWADRLVTTNNGLHPVEQFLQYTVFGNERYLSVWEPLSDNPSNLEWLRHRLTLPSGYEINGLAANDEYLCISAELRSSNSTRAFQHGKLFFWNGLDTTYEFYIDIPEGAPQAAFTYNNTIYVVISGALYCWPGGKNLVKLRTLADTDSEYSDTTDQTELYPNMMTVRRNILLIAYPSYTTNQSLEYSVRSWGQREKNFPMSIGNNYNISTGTRYNTGGNLYIGGVWSFGDTLYTAWRDGADYGLDVVDNSSDPATSASWESMEFESGDGTHEKQAISLSIEPGSGIPSGYTILPKFRTNWSTSWTYGDALSSSNNYVMDFDDRFKMIEYGVDISHDGTATSPLEITAIKFAYDDLSTEREWGGG